MPDYDSPWKDALDFFFEAFLELFFPEAHADIDWSRECESLDKELQQIAPEAEIGRRYVDKLVKVWLTSGEEQWVLVHIEVQMSEDRKFPWWMYVYNCRLFDKYNREVASFAVLGDDNPDWRRKATATGAGGWKRASASRSSSCWTMRQDDRSWRKAPIPLPR